MQVLGADPGHGLRRPVTDTNDDGAQWSRR